MSDERKPSLSDVSDDCQSCTEYIEAMPPHRKGGFLRQLSSYSLKEEPVEKLARLSKDYEFVVTFADWCGDARRAVPVLALIEQKTGIKIRALGGMEKPDWGSSELWAVPPSPPEVKKFGITSSPTILIFDKRTGQEIGRIKTRPRKMPTVEEELVAIIEEHSSEHS